MSPDAPFFSPPPLRPPVVRGRRVELLPLDPRNAADVYQWSVDPSSAFRWRFRGATPSFEEFSAAIWQGVLAQFVVTRRSTGEPVALVAAFNPDTRSGYAYLATLVRPDLRGAGWPIEGVIVFVEYVFQHFALRKLYMESIAPNAATFSSGFGRLMNVEGVLREHEFYDGAYLDTVVSSITRDDFFNSPVRRRTIRPAKGPLDDRATSPNGRSLVGTPMGGHAPWDRR